MSHCLLWEVQARPKEAAGIKATAQKKMNSRFTNKTRNIVEYISKKNS